MLSGNQEAEQAREQFRVTALTRYARLECPGIWRAEPDAQRLDVVVSFGDSSLVISDTAGRALSHWSLAAVARINPGEVPALYTPSAEATELLEVADDTMVEAVETVRRAVARARPRGGRVRALALAASLAAVVAASVFWLPEALVRHAVAVLPEPSREEMGTRLFAAIERVSRPPCRGPRADRALAAVAARLAPAVPGGVASVVVVPDAVERALALPGGTIVAGRALVEDHETPEVLAGYVLAEAVRAGAEPPLADLLEAAGTWAVVRLLTTGHLPETAFAGYAEARLTDPPAAPPAPALLPAFAAAGLPSTPYAYARDVTGESVLPLVEGDPMRGEAALPLMSDGDWVALQNVCGP
jgi:hypothetical protein